MKKIASIAFVSMSMLSANVFASDAPVVGVVAALSDAPVVGFLLQLAASAV